MGTASGTSKTKLLLAVVLVVVVVGGVAVGYFLTQPTFPGLIMGTTDSVETCLDPARAWDFFGWEMIQSMSSGLIEYKPGATTGGVEDIVPSLASSWSLSSDNMSWTFNLRQGVKFHDDGREFNATDVKYTIERGISINDPDGAFGGLGFSDIIKNITVVSKYVVVFNLKKPFGPFLQFMTMQCTYMVDYKYAPATTVVEYVDGNARASYPLGLGPYYLDSWVRTAGRDVQLILKANPDYWNASGGYPKESQIMIKMYADATGLDFAITSGQVDVAFRHLTVAQYDAIKSNPKLTFWQGTGAMIQYICFQERHAPYDQPEVRQAIAAAIDRSEICSTVYLGQADPLYSMIPNGMSFHKDVFKQLGDKNITKSVELLAKHGYNSGNKLKVNITYESSGHYPQSAELVQTIKSELEATGVMEVKLNGLDWSAYKTYARTNKLADVYIYGWYPDFIDADDYIQPFYDSVGCGWLATGYNNSAMDKLVSWARFNVSATVRNTVYGQIQNLSVVDCPLVPVYQYKAFAITKLTVHGVVLDITQNFRNWLLYRE